MQAHAAAIRAEGAAEAVWLLQHEAVYTGGTSALDADLLVPGDIPAVRNGRGGQWTYHGPGQRIAYVMLDIAARGHDVRALVHGLESWVIASLADCNVAGHRRDGLPGVWVQTGNSRSGMDKIAAIGIRISRWVSWHGLAINLNPELESFDAIVPCGVRDGGVTSLAALGVKISMSQLDQRLQARFHDFF
jgi:lipoyl(octanoyl) transferase